jgi:mannose-6-phosphate isomerase-like protein (cupin superfamily)
VTNGDEQEKPMAGRRFGLAVLLLPLIVTSCARKEKQSVEPVAPSKAPLERSPEAPAPSADGRNVRVWAPGEGDHLWVFPRSKDVLGPGGEFHIYLDHRTDGSARASFAKFSLGVGGALAEHRHENTEELAYLLSGRGVVMMRENEKLKQVPVESGSAWYIPPAAWHTIKNTGQEPLTLVFATVPNHETSLLSFFRKVGSRPGDAPPLLSQEDIAKLGLAHDFVKRPSEAKEPAAQTR